MGSFGKDVVTYLKDSRKEKMQLVLQFEGVTSWDLPVTSFFPEGDNLDLQHGRNIHPPVGDRETLSVHRYFISKSR